ncbi:MAG: thiol-disulfide isomerase [Rhodospirillales bacterium]|nr:thiol-disulfide isomerase [Rhodospirillales bacterium]
MMTRTACCVIALLSALAFAGPAARAEMAPPQVVEKLTAVPDRPYDEMADAHADVALAISRAAATHKYVLLDFGGNWCPDCRITAGVLAMSSLKTWVAKNFVVVFIDAGRMNKNLDIAQAYDVKITAVPTMIVLDPQGHMVNAGNPSALKDARGMSPQAIVDTIYGWIQKAG